jgi:hypothetical protein
MPNSPFLSGSHIKERKGCIASPFARERNIFSITKMHSCIVSNEAILSLSINGISKAFIYANVIFPRDQMPFFTEPIKNKLFGQEKITIETSIEPYYLSNGKFT